MLSAVTPQGVAARRWGSSRVDLQACKLGTGRRFTTSWLGKPWRYPT